MAKPPKRKRPVLNRHGKHFQVPGSLAEKFEAYIGDAKVLAQIVAYELLALADLVNRLRLAEEAVTGDFLFGEITVANADRPRYEDIVDAMLLPSEMATLPLAFIREQRARWEEELARYGLVLDSPALRSRSIASSQRSRALQLLREGDAASVKRTATYAHIADELRITGKDRERQVRRIISENVKAQSSASSLDRRLLSRELKPLDELADDTRLIPPDDSIEEIVLKTRRKLGID